ncbi:MAG: hypothetical protein NTX65_16575 [Ignavibacteriales bacterium]|nr:hypothetical protein [Ignavibacteriales bacterium]
MKEKYPIVRIDRSTMQDFLPMLMHKGIFSNYLSLPIKEEILETERKRLGVAELTPELQRSALTAAGQYRSTNFVVRDFGDYAIAFSANMYADYIGKIETELLDKKTHCTDPVEDGLKRVRLFKLAHRLVLVILSKVYEKRTFTQLEISKHEMRDWLGYSSSEKNIYRDISDAMFSLTWLNYQIFKYRNKTKIDPRYKAFGNFIYNVVETPKGYIIDVNMKFVGCVSSLFNDKRGNTPEMFERGYLSYPTSIISATREYSTAAYLLTNYLIAEQGNVQLNDKDYKVVAFTVKRFMWVMNINSGRATKRKAEFLKALAEIAIISEISPSVANLTNLSPSELENTVIHIKVKSDVKELDSDIKSNHLGASSNHLGVK